MADCVSTSVWSENYTVIQGDDVVNDQPKAGTTGEGEYVPAGERQGVESAFSAHEVASAFEVDIQRVHAAFAGEFGLDGDGGVDSRQTQVLAEVILGDLPQDKRESALMKLGAFTPRTDHDTGIGEETPAEDSDGPRDVEQGI